MFVKYVILLKIQLVASVAKWPDVLAYWLADHIS